MPQIFKLASNVISASTKTESKFLRAWLFAVMFMMWSRESVSSPTKLWTSVKPMACRFWAPFCGDRPGPGGL